MVWSSGKDASWMPPCGVVSGTSSWDEVPGQTQVQVERLYLCTGLGTPRDPPAGAGWSPTTDKLFDDGWMDVYSPQPVN